MTYLGVWIGPIRKFATFLKILLFMKVVSNFRIFINPVYDGLLVDHTLTLNRRRLEGKKIRTKVRVLLYCLKSWCFTVVVFRISKTTWMENWAVRWPRKHLWRAVWLLCHFTSGKPTRWRGFTFARPCGTRIGRKWFRRWNLSSCKHALWKFWVDCPFLSGFKKSGF